MAKDAIYQGTREVHTFVDLANGAGVLIRKTEQELGGSYYTTMSALLLSAFTLEAYLNHLGEKTITLWEEIEPIKVMDKYGALCKNFDIRPNFSKRPYQTLRTLFKFRNAIAHGKSEVLPVTKAVSSHDQSCQHSRMASWEEYCTIENAKRAKEDVAAVITELHKEAGLGEHPFIHGIASGSLKIRTPK